MKLSRKGEFAEDDSDFIQRQKSFVDGLGLWQPKLASWVLVQEVFVNGLFQNGTGPGHELFDYTFRGLFARVVGNHPEAPESLDVLGNVASSRSTQYRVMLPICVARDDSLQTA